MADGSFNFFFGGDTVATNKARLTKRAVDGFEPRSDNKPFIAFDTKVKGFGCRISPTGVKTFVLEYRPGAGGRGVGKRRLTLGRYGAMTVDQARQAALTALAHVRLGSDPQEDKSRQRASLTVGDLIDVFLTEHVDAKLKATTTVGYRIALEKLRAVHGGMKATRLTRAHVATLHTRMAENPYAANRFAAIVSKLFSWAGDRGLLPDGHVNPATRIRRYKEQGRERFLTGEEFARLGDVLRLAETEGLPYAVNEAGPNARHAAKPGNRRTFIDPFAVAAIRLLILTGARLREILHAKWENVDAERGMIFLPDSKTGRKPLYLNEAALAVLDDLPRLNSNPYILPGQKEGAPRADLKKPWEAVARAAGLDGLRLHDLRHSFASVGVGASLGLQIIGGLLGHSQPATTARYAHVANDPMRRAVECIGATIQTAMSRSGRYHRATS
jgi:integrase